MLILIYRIQGKIHVTIQLSMMETPLWLKDLKRPPLPPLCSASDFIVRENVKCGLFTNCAV